ncbi:MAG TPA: YceI family protein [candidate division Zixibacteria bacterium]|nr:YceI family protein [candidate division Zixibacteria bacterium]
MKRLKQILIMSTLVIAGVSAFAQNKHETDNGYRFYIEDPMNRNTITFKSEAPLEDIIGTSNQITGFINFNPENPQKNGFADLNVPVSSLNTGIPMRDEHLHGPGWLDAGAFPEINLEINEIKKAELIKETDNSRTFELTAVGNFTLHGINREIDIPARITFLKESDMTRMRLPGHLLAVRADFTIQLADYEITGPEGMPIIGAKVGKEIKISVNLIGGTVLPSLAQEKM